MTDWVRLWHDMPTDPKWRTIARKSGQRVGDVIAVFNFMMVSASANADERGHLSGTFDREDIATALDIDEEDVSAILSAMDGKVLEGRRLLGWEKRQPKREDSTAAKRQAEWRERKASHPVTHDNAEKRPEAEAEADYSVSTDTVPETDEADVKPEHVVEAWNAMADTCGLPKARLTPERRRKLGTFLRRNTVEDITEAIWKIPKSDFLCGRNNRDWRADLDFILQPSKFPKILEGSYG